MNHFDTKSGLPRTCGKNKRFQRLHPALLTAGVLLIGMIGLMMNTSNGYAQTADKAYISNGEVTGDLAQGYRLRGEDRTYFQPVRFILPEGTAISAASAAGYVENEADPGLFSFRPGDVYRMKINRIPQRPNQELFPSVEMLNRLYPPAGKALDFPVEIRITQEDLDLAIAGKMVTRVIYLERSDDAVPVDSSPLESGISIEVPLGQSPVEIAETRGKVMAILRIGSRLPNDQPNDQNRFYFGLPPFQTPTRLSVPIAQNFTPEL